MKQKSLTTSQITMFAVCIILGLISKRIISPFTNVITDFIRLPGGSAATAFSLLFLVIGASCSIFPLAGTIMGFVQGLLALSLGMSGYQGALAVITYTLPGIAVDVIRRLYKQNDLFFYITCTAAANICSAVGSCILVYHFNGLVLVLWLLVAACAGIIAGLLACRLVRRLRALPESPVLSDRHPQQKEIVSNYRKEGNKMKSRKLSIVVMILFISTFIVACGNRNASEVSSVVLKSADGEVAIELSDLDQTTFQGVLVNGKGEESSHSYRGVELSELFAENGIEISEDQTVTVTSSDNYSADYSGAEIMEKGRVYIAVQEDGEAVPGIDDDTQGAEIVVFGDPDSKRCVRYAAVIEIH